MFFRLTFCPSLFAPTLSFVVPVDLGRAPPLKKGTAMQRELASLPYPDLPLPAADPAMLEALLQPRLSLFWGAHTPTRALLAYITVLAARGHRVSVFDGGNRFDGYFVARLARRLSSDPRATLEHIRLSRAFTCFQLAELVKTAPTGLGAQESDTVPGSGAPAPGPSVLFVLDMLTTFYDESVSLSDAERLLTNTISHLKRLASTGPVIVGAREPRVLVKERWSLLDRLQVTADAAWLLRSPEDPGREQLSLF
ncbi:MAG TPA: hypothetical protein VMX56_09150 [Anaerolineales bacterium]|nr:hypothetical protein [Anaerolineales bacterium]